MNLGRFTTVAAGFILALSLACGGGGGGASTPAAPTATTVATPVVTAPAYIAAYTAGSYPVTYPAITVSTQTQPGCSYKWTVSDTSSQIISGQGTPSIQVSGPFATVPENLQVAVEVSGASTNAYGNAVIQVAPPPSVAFNAIPDPENNPCLTGTPFAVGVTTQAQGTAYQWTVTGASLTTGQGTNGITLTTASAGNVIVKCQVTDPVTSLVSSISETFQSFDSSLPKPTAQTVIGPNPVTYGATGLVYTVPLQSGCTYSWTVDQGTITAGAATNSITYNAPPVPSNPYASPYLHFYLQISNAGGITQCDFTANAVKN